MSGRFQEMVGPKTGSRRRGIVFFHFLEQSLYAKCALFREIKREMKLG
jgi:hypothetical protein